MAAERFETLKDLEGIVLNATPESLTLEYKSSAIFHNGKGQEHLCKAVTAFANSVGGHFIIGVDANKNKAAQLDEGVPKSIRDWIYQVINANVQPALDTLRVNEVALGSGFYYAIEVARSSKAPHQSVDRKYYKRRGSVSEPMEHYEIDDIRNRPTTPSEPLRADLVFHGLTAFLRIKNEHTVATVDNVKCSIETNFAMNRRGVESLCSRGLKSLRPLEELKFILDSTPTMIENISEPEMHIKLQYQFRSALVRDTISYYLADLIHSAIVRPPMLEAVEGIAEKLERVERELARLRTNNERFMSIMDGSGLRLSIRTLEGLAGSKRRHSPMDFDWRGYAVIAGISQTEAIKLNSIFHAFGHMNGPMAEYEKLPIALREKFEQFFDVPSAFPPG